MAPSRQMVRMTFKMRGLDCAEDASLLAVADALRLLRLRNNPENL